MPVAQYFNKATLKGTVSRSQIIDFDNKKTGGKNSFLSMEINTGKSNKVKTVLFPTANNPNKHNEIASQYPVNSKVEITGKLQEKEYESQSGQKRKDRSVSIISIRPLEDESKIGAKFVLQGLVKKIKESSDGVNIEIDYIESYTPTGSKEKKEVVSSFELTVPGSTEKFDELLDGEDLIKGCNAKFKGIVFNQIEFDDYGDIVGNNRMFAVEKITDIVEPSEIEEPEVMPFQ